MKRLPGRENTMHTRPEDREIKGMEGGLVELGSWPAQQENGKQSQTTWGWRGRPVWSSRPTPGKKFSDVN